MGLEVVHVGAVAVGLLADAVAGAVDECGRRSRPASMTSRAAASTSQPCSGAAAPRRRRARGRSPRRGRAATISKISSYVGRDGLADEADAGQVAVDAPAGLSSLAQRSIRTKSPCADRRVAAGGRLVVGVAAVRADGRRSAGDRSSGRAASEVVHDRGLHLASRRSSRRPGSRSAIRPPGQVVGRRS